MQTDTSEVLAKFNKALTALEAHYKELNEAEKSDISLLLENLPKAVEKRIKQMKTKRDDSDDKFVSDLKVEPVKRTKKPKGAEQLA